MMLQTVAFRKKILLNHYRFKMILYHFVHIHHKTILFIGHKSEQQT